MNWFCSNKSSRKQFIKIVHPGGHVELHDRPILAAELLARNPKCCVALPTVFQHPHDVVSPETTLLLGKKYYVVPLATIRKLQLQQRLPRRQNAADRRKIGGKISGDRDRDSDSLSACWLFGSGKSCEIREEGDRLSGGGLGAKIRVASGESSSEESTEVMVMKREGGGGGRRRGGDGGTSSPGRISLVSTEDYN